MDRLSSQWVSSHPTHRVELNAAEFGETFTTSSSDEFFMCLRCSFERELRRLFATVGTRSARVFRNSRLDDW